MSLPLFILYGSATGNSQKIAKDLAANYENKLPPPFTEIILCQGNDFKRKCSPIWETEPTKGKYGLVFVTATTGNGDAPENASRFVRYLKRKTTPDTKPFRHVSFGVLGLGDTNYDKFCETAKIADKCLQKCGGTRSKPLGCADEATGLEDVVESWIADVVPILCEACSEKIAQHDGGLDTKDEEKKDDDAKIMVPESNSSRPNIPNTTSSSRGSVPDVAAIRARVANPPLNSSVSHPKPPANTETIPSTTYPPISSSVASTAISSGTADREITSPSPLCILYGSATGNAEHIAKDLATRYEKILSESTSSYFPKVICCELDKYKKNCMSYWENDSSLNHEIAQKHGVLIISSTTGNGEAPENASRFVRYIKRKTTAPTMPFRHVAYTVLGLGDTNYDQFCNAAKVIDKKMHDLGGTRVKDVACADEGTGLEETVDPWVETIFDILIERCKGNASTLPKHRAETAVETTTKVDNKPVISTSPALNEKVTAPLAPVCKDDVEQEVFCAGISMLRELLKAILPTSDGSIPKVKDNSVPEVSSALSTYQAINENNRSDELNTCNIPLADLETMTISSKSSSGINYTAVRPFNSQIVGARYLTNTEVKCAQKVSDTFYSRQVEKGSNLDIDDIVITAAKEFQVAFPLDNEEGKAKGDEVFSRNGKRVIAMTLSLPDDSSLEYSPGDSIGLVASNTPEATKFLLNMLYVKHGVDPEMQITVDSGEVTSVKHVIRDRLDVCSPINNKRIIAQLSRFATNKQEEMALRFLSSKESLAEEIFQKYIEEQRRSVFDILLEFPSSQCVTLDGMLAVIPSITPRYYSICSSPLEKNVTGKHTLDVVFSVVDFMIPANLPHTKKRRIGGLVTRHLETICAPLLSQSHSTEDMPSLFTPRVRIFPKPTNDFRLPAQLTKPLILIGPGTGIAPFMGFLAHRKAEILALDTTLAAKVATEGTWRGDYTFDQNDLSVTTGDASGLSLGSDYRSNQKIGEVDVYFGCRHSDHDWLFKNEMEGFVKDGVITNLNVSFSREGGNGMKEYVQDKMKSNADRVARMVINDDAIVFICGDGNKMAKDVQSTLIDIVAQHKSQNSSSDVPTVNLEAKQYLEQMKVNRRLIMDIWS